MRLEIDLAHTHPIRGIDVCALSQTFIIRSFKYTLIVEDGLRPKNLAILAEISHGILIRTRDHHVNLCGARDLFDRLTQPQLMGGGMPSFKESLIYEGILF